LRESRTNFAISRHASQCGGLLFHVCNAPGSRWGYWDGFITKNGERNKSKKLLTY
jgi:hypothetical protein